MLRRRISAIVALVALAALLVPGWPTRATSGTTFRPPSGQKLLLIGQDTASIDAYVIDVGITPGGVVGYTSINDQEGIHSRHDNGAGPNYLDYLAGQYPNSTIEEAIWIVNQCQNIIDNTRWGKVSDYNERMDTLIATLVGYNRPIFLRWGYEFDGTWNKFDPECYKGAWIRMWERIQLNNAQDHIAMVWQSSSYCGGKYGGYPLEAWYPGDQYVDWVGLSYFTPQDCNWSAVNEVVQFARAHNKPVMICESTPQRYDIGDLTYTPNSDGTGRVSKTADQIWSEWFVPYFNFIGDNSDVIAAVTYINADWDSQRMWGTPYRSGYWGDSRVQANPIIKANWTNTINAGGWLNASPTLFSTLGYSGN